MAGGGYKERLEALHAELHDAKRKLARFTAKQYRKPITIVPIGDSHSDPNIPNDRYRWLGRFIADIGADVVVDIGDFNDMASLSHFDYGKKVFEGRMYRKDIDHGIKAREALNDALGGHKPRKVACLGNHEDRIRKVADSMPQFSDLISTDDLKLKELGWEQYDFGVVVPIAGIAFCHYHISGVNGKAIGGMHQAANLIRLGLMSCVQGHSHTFDYSERTRADGQKVMGVSVGCYFSHFMPWAGAANQEYWRGIVVLRDVEDGYGTIEKYSMEAIEAKYGGD